MIALCATHAALADGGRWTKDQLREMKQKPFVQSGRISAFYDYLRRDVVCLMGTVAYNVQDILDIDGERVIGFERDATGYDRLNLLIRDTNGRPVLVMENNMWTAYNRELHDIICTAHGKELQIIAKDGLTNLQMRFRDFSVGEFREYLVKGQNEIRRIDSFLEKIGKPTTVPAWIITGTLSWGGSSLKIRGFEIEAGQHNVFKIGFVVGGKAAFRFDRRPRGVGMS
jgi:hypothetical protein